MKEAHCRMKESRDQKMFNIVQLEVKWLINETTYLSDIHLQYVQSCQNPNSDSYPNSGSGSREMLLWIK